MKFFEFFCLSALVTVMSSSMIPQKSSVIPASLVQLIASPSDFDGKRVSVIGFLYMTRDGYYLFLSQDDYKNAITPNSVLIEPTELIGKQKKDLTLKYVRVIGTFHVLNHGTERPNTGINDIQSIAFWSDPQHPVADRIKQIPGVKE